jgi:hypothetical protein
MAGPTVLDLVALADELAVTDVLYALRGSGAGADRKTTADRVIPTVVTQNTTTAINLATYFGDLVIFSTPVADITLTFSNALPNGRKLIIVNKASAFDVVVAGSHVGIVHPTDDILVLVSDGTNLLTEAKTSNINAVSGGGYTILDTDGYDIIDVTTAAVDRTITLPTLADNLGRVITINKVDSGVGIVIVDGEGAETIDGKTTLELRKQHYSIKLYASATEWNIISTDHELKKSRRNIKALNGAGYTITDVDGVEVIEVTAGASDRTIVLPTLADNQERILTISKVDAGAGSVIVDGEGAEAINEVLTIELPKRWDSLVLFGGTAEWEIISERISCQLRLDGYAGFGAVDNKIMQFTNSRENYGNVFSENHSTGYGTGNDGLEITVNKSGKYAFTFSLFYGASSLQFGLSLNSSQLTTSIISINSQDTLCIEYAPASGLNATVAWTGYLSAGDVIRPHSGGNAPSAAKDFFTATYLGS